MDEVLEIMAAAICNACYGGQVWEQVTDKSIWIDAADAAVNALQKKGFLVDIIEDPPVPVEWTRGRWEELIHDLSEWEDQEELTDEERWSSAIRRALGEFNADNLPKLR